MFNTVIWHNQEDYWGLAAKFHIDFDLKHIIIHSGVTTLDIKIDIYSMLKQYMALRNNMAYEFPIRTIGGDDIGGGQAAGDMYFLINGYRVVYDPTKVKVNGILFSDDFDTPWLNTGTLLPVYPATVSSLALSVAPDLSGLDLSEIGVPTASDNANAVWKKPVVEATAVADSMGAFVEQGLHHLEKTVWIDTEAVAAGDGSQSTPYNDLSVAIDYAESKGLNKLKIFSDILLDRNLKNFIVEGVGVPVVDCNGQDLTKSEFTHLSMEGAYTGSIVVQESVLKNNFSLNGFFENCALAGDLFCVANANIFLKNCASSIPGLGRPTISMNTGFASSLSVRGNQGGMTIKDCDHINDVVTVEVAQGSLTFDSSCTAGNMVARGTGKFVDNSNGATVTNEMQDNITWAHIKALQFGKWFGLK